MNLWLDEAVSYFTSQQSFNYILANTDFHPPLYYILLKFWIKIFGESIFAMRSLSIIIALLVIGVSIELFRLYNKNKFNVKMFILALIFNTTFLYHSTQIRQYILGLFFVMLAVYLFLKDNKYFFIPMTLAVYTHYFTVFAFLPFVIKKRYWKRFMYSILLFIPYLPIAIKQVQSRIVAQDWYGSITLNTFSANIYNYVAQVEFFNSWFIIGLIIFVTVVYFSMNIIAFLENREPKYYLLLYYFLVPFVYIAVCFVTKNVFHPRYFFFLSIFFMIPVYATKLRVKYLFLLFILVNIVITVNYIREQDYELRDISRYISEHKEAEIILAESPMSLLPIMYYTREQNFTYVLVPYQDITVYGGHLIEYFEKEKVLKIVSEKEVKKIDKKIYYLQSSLCLVDGAKILQLKGINLILFN